MGVATVGAAAIRGCGTLKIFSILEKLPDRPRGCRVANVLRRAQLRKRLIYGALLGQHQSQVEHCVRASSRDGALIRRPGSLHIAGVEQQVAEARTSLAMPARFGTPESLGCAGQIATPLENVAQEDRALGIVKLIGFPVGRFSPLQVPRRLTFSTVSQQFFNSHRWPPMTFT
jgi:hypothetical protein